MDEDLPPRPRSPDPEYILTDTDEEDITDRYADDQQDEESD